MLKKALLLLLVVTSVHAQTAPEVSPASPTGSTSPAGSTGPTGQAEVAGEPKLLPKIGESPPPPQPSSKGLTGVKQVLSPPKGGLDPFGSNRPVLELEQNAGLSTRISFDLREIDVMDVLKFLAIKSNLNIVGGKGLAGTVTLLLNDVTVQEAIEIVLSVSRL
ncbi:MAG: hypothetical protein HYY44_06755, partial [Deltaproteobacteria bacterium]|nr:hypothetical protein [Deltaproteobacteria bacterium]